MTITKEIILNTYRKFKSFVFYSTNHSYLIKDLSEFESDFEKFNKSIEDLTNAINTLDDVYFEFLINRIEVVPMIKNLVNNRDSNTLFSDAPSKPSSVVVDSLNYFIRSPIELFIIDTLWTLICFSAVNNKDDFQHVYANTPARDLIIYPNDKLINRINFKSLSIFEPYFEKYKAWQTTIIDKAVERKTNKLDSKLISIDITGFYYSVEVNFKSLSDYLTLCSDDYVNYLELTSLIESIYKKYKNILTPYCDKPISNLPIPIGLVSSGFVANYVLLFLDKQLNNNTCVVKANRYVDDILILLDGQLEKTFPQLIETIFGDVFSISNYEDKTFCINGTSLKIKNEKTRLFDIGKRYSDHTLRKLKKEIFVPSGISLFPKYVANFEQLYDRAVADNKSLKIRENIAKPIINSSKLASSLSGFLLMKRETEDDSSLERKTINSIFSLFDSELIVSTYNRWGRIFSYFIFANQKGKFKFSRLESFIKQSIKKIKFSNNTIPNITQKAVKTELYELLNIFIAESVAPFSLNNIDEDIEESTKILSRKIRESNLFDHGLVSFPLSNYLNDNQDSNLTIFNGHDFSLGKIDFAKKVLLSPRFIHLDEYFYYRQCQEIYLSNVSSIHYDELLIEYNTKMLSIFSSKIEPISITKTNESGYSLFTINYDSGSESFDDVPIALANVNLLKCNLTRKKGYDAYLTFSKGTIKQKSSLIDLLNDCYFENVLAGKKQNTEEQTAAKFLVFPEYYLPIEWLNILIRFSRKAGVSIVTGLRPIKIGKKVYNLQAVAIPFKDAYGHKESMVFIREKNNYAPLDKQIIHNSRCSCSDSINPVYFLFDNKKIKYSSFICYELTDVQARAIFKNKTDIVISSEYNEDIYYFSNIVESSARDLCSFIVQVNSSNYGDTRIVAPYRDKYKEIATITGGVKDSIHIGIIKLKQFKEYMRDYQAADAIPEYRNINPTLTKSTEKYKIFKKPSAGIKK